MTETPSHWGRVPLDVLTSLLPYLKLRDIKDILSLCGDPVIKSRLEYDNPNGFILYPSLEYLYKQKLSHNLPLNSTTSLRESYENYLRMLNGCDLDELLIYAIQKL